jgi:pantetheine-phosphate adenylyltransferase
MSIAVYPGTFDPVTYGHIDIIRRAAAIFDTVVVGVLRNYTKKPFFDIPERIDMIREVTSGIPNVKVTSFEGLVVDFCQEEGATVIVRGIRSFADFEYEQIMAQTNRKLAPDVDTMFFTTSPEYSFVSSSSVRELALFDGDITAFVPEPVRMRICKKKG